MLFKLWHKWNYYAIILVIIIWLLLPTLLVLPSVFVHSPVPRPGLAGSFVGSIFMSSSDPRPLHLPSIVASPDCGCTESYLLMNSTYSGSAIFRSQVWRVWLSCCLSLLSPVSSACSDEARKAHRIRGWGPPPANCQWGTEARNPTPSQVSLEEILLSRIRGDCRPAWHLDCSLREKLSQKTQLSCAQVLDT